MWVVTRTNTENEEAGAYLMTAYSQKPNPEQLEALFPFLPESSHADLLIEGVTESPDGYENYYLSEINDGDTKW